MHKFEVFFFDKMFFFNTFFLLRMIVTFTQLFLFFKRGQDEEGERKRVELHRCINMAFIDLQTVH